MVFFSNLLSIYIFFDMLVNFTFYYGTLGAILIENIIIPERLAVPKVPVTGMGRQL